MDANIVIALVVLLSFVVAASARLNSEAKKRRKLEAHITKEKPWRRQ
jgi:hypothetical protein